MVETTNDALQQVLKEDSKIFQLIFAASFVLFLVIALVAQTLSFQWRSWLPGAEGGKTVIGGVKASVYTFMSYLL